MDVIASAVHLQTEDAVTGQVVNRKFMNDLPLVDRDFTNLAFLAPGVTESNLITRKIRTAASISFQWRPNSTGRFDRWRKRDELRNKTAEFRMCLIRLRVDSVEEFKVQQSNFTAEFGFAGGNSSSMS